MTEKHLKDRHIPFTGISFPLNEITLLRWGNWLWAISLYLLPFKWFTSGRAKINIINRKYAESSAFDSYLDTCKMVSFLIITDGFPYGFPKSSVIDSFLLLLRILTPAAPTAFPCSTSRNFWCLCPHLDFWPLPWDPPPFLLTNSESTFLSTVTNFSVTTIGPMV